MPQPSCSCALSVDLEVRDVCGFSADKVDDAMQRLLVINALLAEDAFASTIAMVVVLDALIV